ncbi:MAG: phosphatase PAP2 family protein [Candidatus Berkiellales bacterium]
MIHSSQASKLKNTRSYWPKFKPLAISCGVGLGMLGLQLGIYYGLIYLGVTSGMLPPALSYLVKWVLWDPKILFYALQDIGLDIAALLYSLSKKDWKGIAQLGATQFVVSLITQTLKLSVDRLRPNGVNHHSFPSGHTSAAFTGASYIHQRYGLTKALPAYFAASIVGCVRVHKLAHYPTDVLAGAGIAILNAYLIVSSKNKEPAPIDPIATNSKKSTNKKVPR